MGRGQDKYKRYILLAAVLLLLPAAIIAILLAASSCSGRNGQVGPVLTAADSLMMSRPEAALDTLLTLDSTVASSLRGRERADYTLLMTEARYKCWLPVAEDTAITKAAGYYRRKGPDSRLARALMMQGAVYQEGGDPVQALVSYKEAEPVMESSGDYEQLGLLNTRIGELYMFSFVNNKEAAARYRKALSCFQKCGREDREMLTLLSLARVMIGESVDSSLARTLQAIVLAQKLEDVPALISGYELMTHICRLKKDFEGILRFSRSALQKLSEQPGGGHMSLSVLNNIYIERTLAYAFLGMPDSAEVSASHIRWQKSAADSIAGLWISSAIAESRADWRQAFVQSQRYHAMTDSIQKASERMQLRNKELLYDRQAMEVRNMEILRERNLIIVIFTTLLVALTSIIAALNQRFRKLREYSANLLASINISGETEIREAGVALLYGIRDSTSDKEIKDDIRGIIVDMTDMISEINNAYFKHKDSIRSIKFVSVFDSILRKHFPEKQTYEKMRRLCGTLYPGVLEQIEREHPSLTRNDLLLIALMGCGFPTGAICAVKGMTIGSLNSQKTRTAKKIGSDIRLSEYVAGKFSKNMSASAVSSDSDAAHEHPQPDFSHADIK